MDFKAITYLRKTDQGLEQGALRVAPRLELPLLQGAQEQRRKPAGCHWLTAQLCLQKAKQEIISLYIGTK